MRALVLWFLPLSIATFAFACSDPNQGTTEPTSTGVASMQGATPATSTSREIWVTVRHAAGTVGLTPGSGPEWWVHEVDTSGPEVRVTRIDVAPAGFVGRVDAVLLDAPDDAVVLRGFFEPARRGSEEGATFVATAGYRGMPDRSWSPTDVFVQGRWPLDGASAPVPPAIDLTGAEAPWVDRAWLENRVSERGAVVAGSGVWLVERRGVERFVASQVFIHLPDRTHPCPVAATERDGCAAGTVPTFTRDLDRCLVPAACVKPGFCPLVRPSCGSGYALRSWPAGPVGCPAFACDPAFLAP